MALSNQRRLAIVSDAERAHLAFVNQGKTHLEAWEQLLLTAAAWKSSPEAFSFLRGYVQLASKGKAGR